MNHEQNTPSNEPPTETQRRAEQPADGAEPHIWVGSWLDYNNGILHGQWITAARDADAVAADIAAMLARSPTARKYGEPAEDWGIFDYEHFGPLRVGEQESVSYVTAVARGIASHGPAFAAWADLRSDDADQAGQANLDGFEDAYLGGYDSLEAYAEHLVNELGYNQLIDERLPEHLRAYVEINLRGLANDLRLGGEVQVCDRDGGGVWVFAAR